jgi:methylmalonyl-CoA/ethylmalonyl-CoA epimerase
MSIMHSNLPWSGNDFHHIGIVVAEFEDLRKVLVDLLGGERDDEVIVAPDLGIEVMWIRIGGVALELIRPLDEKARAAAVLRAGQGGVHHLAVTVDDIDRALAEARARGIDPLEETPRIGIHGTRIAFLPAESASGALIELVEARTKPLEPAT